MERYGYVHTTSGAGRPSRVEFDPRHVDAVRVWHNTYGNPSYSFLIDGPVGVFDNDGMVTTRPGFTVLYLVDDYGAMSGLSRLSRTCVPTRKALFAGWL